MEYKIKSWSGPGGALLVSVSIPGVTQEIKGDTASSYGGYHFVGETITDSTAREISRAMGWEYQDQPGVAVDKTEPVHVSDEELSKIAKAVVSAFTFMSENCFYHCSHSADCRHPSLDFSCMLCSLENCPILQELS